MSASKPQQLDRKKTLECLEKALACRVCAKTVVAPLKMCLRGHVICQSCAPANCPSCGEDISLDNPAVVLNVLRILTGKCRYSSQGCRQIPLDKDHETFCSYRPVLCRMNCEVDLLPFSELLEHIYYKHDGLLITEEHSSFQLHYGYNKTRPIILFGEFFWLTVNTNSEFLTVKLEALPDKKTKQLYFVTVELKKRYFVFTDTVQAYIRKPWEKEMIAYFEYPRQYEINGEEHEEFDYFYNEAGSEYPDQDCAKFSIPSISEKLGSIDDVYMHLTFFTGFC